MSCTIYHVQFTICDKGKEMRGFVFLKEIRIIKIINHADEGTGYYELRKFHEKKEKTTTRSASVSAMLSHR